MASIEPAQAVARLFEESWDVIRQVFPADLDSLARQSGSFRRARTIVDAQSLSRLLFYSDEMKAAVGDHVPYEDLQLDTARMAKWHPLNRALALGARVMLNGMLLAAKGDRVAMHSSVETRYPFLDEA